MNSEINLDARMLNLYPIHAIKEYFMLTGVKADVISQIACIVPTGIINNFATDNINHNKQHIHIFEINPPFNSSTFNLAANPFPFPIIKTIQGVNEYSIYIRPQLSYFARVVNLVSNTGQDIEMIFPQPILITLTNTHLIIRATILERNVGAYMNDGGNSRAFNITKSNDDDFISEIVQYFLMDYAIVKCDLNAGVKYLVDNGVLDFRQLEYLNTDSTDTIKMHENLTFKQRYPTIYDATMLAPLNKSSFKYLIADNGLCPNFTADPSLGQINIPLYPDNVNQIDNVIGAILTNN